ncbi:thioredoxin fold domain-containing protein [Aliiroseovarius sp. S1339]|uniref:thioredoxin fold domain-containing protein n=1 Tax=Aliiroseovarius sp. S1339 TaxID=2936990 RepID=UPI0020C0AB1F|nr:thioredoxin fold domain-containing protein [Aliiroseovarius sp. S1339]MCK8463651.1 thioredoxin fold domain-containing protein [Aliiroseovarius sp. S1339]
MSRIRTALATFLLGLFAVSASATELVMVEEPGCPWCAKWERELGAIYPKTPEGQFAPLRKVQLHDVRRNSDPAELGFALDHPVTFTPTFLLIEDGAEVARLQGYPGEDFFWSLLEKMLIEKTSYQTPTTTDITKPAAFPAPDQATN